MRALSAEHQNQLSTVAGRAGDRPAVGAADGTAVNAPAARTRGIAVLPEQSGVPWGLLNALAAGYWRRWSRLDQVHLCLELEGSGRVDVYRTKADGSAIFVRGVVLDGPSRHELDLELDLRPFEDGGWYWFDLTTDDRELTLHAGGWYARGGEPFRARLKTYADLKQPGDCVPPTAIGEEPWCAAVTALILPDQGKEGRESPASSGGGRARGPGGLDQPNLGG